MFTSEPNRVIFAPLSRPSQGRIYTARIVAIPAMAGGLRSKPADLIGTLPASGGRSGTAKEHPVEPSVSSTPLAPAREPVAAAKEPEPDAAPLSNLG